MTRGCRLLGLALVLLGACRSEEEQERLEAEAAWDSMVEQSRDRSVQLDTMPGYGIPRRDSALLP